MSQARHHEFTASCESDGRPHYSEIACAGQDRTNEDRHIQNPEITQKKESYFGGALLRPSYVPINGPQHGQIMAILSWNIGISGHIIAIIWPMRYIAIYDDSMATIVR